MKVPRSTVSDAEMGPHIRPGHSVSASQQQETDAQKTFQLTGALGEMASGGSEKGTMACMWIVNIVLWPWH